MVVTARKLRVFLCHASENKPIVKDLYDELVRAGFEPWLDSEVLLPGMDWDLEIRKSLRASHVVVVCLSQVSVLKEGYIQKELKFAEDIQAEKPRGTIFLIPLRLDQCETPYDLQNIQWADYTAEDGLKRLVHALNIRAEQLGKDKGKLISRGERARSPFESETAIDSSNSLVQVIEQQLIVLDPVPGVGVFVNRKEMMKTLRSSLADKSRRLVIVQGLPGIGKTSLAAKFVRTLPKKFRAAFWMTCKADQASPDILFAKLHAFFEEQGEPGLAGIWNDPGLNLEIKINRLIRILGKNPYLLVFDEFQNWLPQDSDDDMDEDLHEGLHKDLHPGLRKVFVSILSSNHQSKIILISDKRLQLDPRTLGVTLEHTLLGLDEASAIQVLQKIVPEIVDQELLHQIIDHCDGNPYMLRIFSYLVSHLHRNPRDLLISHETGTKFSELLQAAVKDLDEESRKALELLSVLRLPLQRAQIQALGFRFERIIGPLFDRFLVIKDIKSENFRVSRIVGDLIFGMLSEQRQQALHAQAAKFYTEQRGDRPPANYAQLQLAMEEGYHRSKSGDVKGAAVVIFSVVPLLIDWGYIELAEQSICRALKNSRDHGLTASARAYMGSIADLRGNFPRALKHFGRALQLYETVDNHSGKARMLFRIGRVYNGLAQFDLANDHFQQCIRTCEEHGVTDELAASKLALGWNLQERSGEIERALEQYQETIEVAKRLNDMETLSSVYRQIGFLVWTKRDKKEESQQYKDKAQQYYQQALVISEKHSLVKELGALHSEMGYLYAEWSEYDKAAESCQKAIEIFKAIGNKYGLISAYFNLGKVFESKQDFELAVTAYKQSLDIAAEISDTGSQAYVYFRLGKILAQQNQAVEAQAALSKAILLSQEHELVETLMDAQKALADLNQISN